MMILYERVLPDYERAENRIRLGFERRRLDKAEKDRKKVANDLDDSTARETIEFDGLGNVIWLPLPYNARALVDCSLSALSFPWIYTSSFTETNTLNTLSLTPAGLLDRCNCRDHVLRGKTCEHLWLTARLASLKISPSPHPLDSSLNPPSSK